MADTNARFRWVNDAYQDTSTSRQRVLIGWVGLLHPEDAQSGDPNARWYAYVCTSEGKWVRDEFHSREDATGFVQLIASGHPE